MFSIRVERIFSAAHAIVIQGTKEPLHGHDWRVRVTLEGPTLDSDGLLCDFHLVEGSLDAILAPFANANLNETAPFDTLSPTAEHVAMHIAQALQQTLPESVTALVVAVTEAPGCEARYRME